ncbi:hypothetical protein GFM01_07865 [Rhizobium laguerreae]|uniref:hypothetical protein n=1 Tax=Rhizobium laguerreae TaxID=1076926 RepID=UPI0014423366|nr:hypothetical protein [Rhizobium laguerreae]NKM17752.1 hypothetical protein [Rhizobium laguerreae]
MAQLANRRPPLVSYSDRPISRGIVTPGAAFGPLPSDPGPYMLGSTRNKALSGFSPANLYVAPEGLNVLAPLLKFGTLWPTDEGVFRFPGSQHTEGGLAPQETTFASAAITIHAVLMIYNGQVFSCDFSGLLGSSVAIGAAGVWAHIKLPILLPENSVYGLVPIYSVPVGATVLGQYRIQRHRGEKVWQGASVDAVLTQLAADAPTSAAFQLGYNVIGNWNANPPGQNLAYGPDLIAWKRWDGRPVVCGVLDSLSDRQELAASADERGNYGFLPRLFNSWGYGFFNVGCPGAKAVQTLAASAMKIWQGLDELSAMNPNGKRPYNNYFQQMGRNDNNAASATWLTPIRNLNTRLRTRDPTIPIIGATIPATTTSTDRHQTEAGQSVAVLWGATLAAVNAAILAGNSGTTDNVIDLNLYRMAASGKYRPGNEHLKGTVAVSTGDGVTPTTQLILDFMPSLGQQYTIDLSAGAGTTLSGRIVVDVAGTGPYVCTCVENFSTIVPAGSLVYEQPTPDGTHFNKEYNIQSVALVPASEKAKFVGV